MYQDAYMQSKMKEDKVSMLTIECSWGIYFPYQRQIKIIMVTQNRVHKHKVLTWYSELWNNPWAKLYFPSFMIQTSIKIFRHWVWIYDSFFHRKPLLFLIVMKSISIWPISKKDKSLLHGSILCLQITRFPFVKFANIKDILLFSLFIRKSNKLVV